MSTNNSGDQHDNISLVAFCVCLASVGVIFFGGASWPTAVAVCGLSVMGLGIAFLVLKKP